MASAAAAAAGGVAVIRSYEGLRATGTAAARPSTSTSSSSSVGVPLRAAPPQRRRRSAVVEANAINQFGRDGAAAPAAPAVSLKPPTPLLDTVNYPVHLKNMTSDQLHQLADELRQDTIHTVSKTGGHLGSSLGVIELTVALHHVFDAPRDKILWDVGHQAYPHKTLTGRRSKMHTIRQDNGLAPFTKRSESEYDPFGAGHSSTSISAALGMAVARDLKNENFHCVAVIGDGRGRIIRGGKDVALLGFGTALQSCMQAANFLEERGVSATVADARFCKPLDADMIRRLAKEHPVMIIVEEGAIGGFGSHVLQFLALEGLLDGKLKVRPMCLPDRYIEHGSPKLQLEEAGLTGMHVAATALSVLGLGREALEVRSSVLS
eukprot:jgi/Chlat1/7554/Chrsp63S07054